MIELHLDLKFNMKPWKKALVFSFISYLIVFFILIAIINIVKKGIDFKVMAMMSGAYMAALILSFQYMYKIFKSKYS